MKGNDLKRRFLLIWDFFSRKNKCQKLAKSKANPLQKWQKNGHF